MDSLFFFYFAKSRCFPPPPCEGFSRDYIRKPTRVELASSREQNDVIVSTTSSSRDGSYYAFTVDTSGSFMICAWRWDSTFMRRSGFSLDASYLAR